MKNKDLIFPTLLKAGNVEKSEGGLTKREYFALQILLNQPNMSEMYIAESVVKADMLLEELEND